MRDALVDREPLELVEDRDSASRRSCRGGRRGRSRPCRSAAAAPPSCGSAPATSRCAARVSLVEIERGARRPRRMPLGEAERVEVVAGRLDLAAVDDLVAEAEEDVLDVATHQRRRMERAARARSCASARAAPPAASRRPARSRASPRARPALELLLLRGERRLDRLAHGVERHAGLAVAHFAQRELQRTLAAEVANRVTSESSASDLASAAAASASFSRSSGPRGRPYPTVSPPFAGTGTDGGSRPGSCCGGDDACC